ncbi:MAG: arginine--tRNA ligase [Pseudomonadota bacterium]
MKSRIAELLQTAVDRLVAEGNLPAGTAPAIRVDEAKDKAHGDFASNLAMVLAKPAGKAPRAVAEALLAALPADDAIGGVEIAGPGFLNFRVDAGVLDRQLAAMLADTRLGVPTNDAPETVVIDYSAPNLAKEMHVGHLRSTIIGDALVRVFERLGHTVIRQNHVGDWGTQFGMLLAHFEAEPAGAEALLLSDLEGFYQAAKKRFDAEPAFADRARELVVAMQAGDAACMALWHQFNDITLTHADALYARLGVLLTRDDLDGESRYNDDLPRVVADLEAAGLLTEDAGAKCVFLDAFTNKAGDPLPLIVEKAGGGYLYATSDLATVRLRVREFDCDRSLYVVDKRQHLHFEQVFAVARAAGFLPEGKHFEHLGFGTMNGEDGKPFKTRAGGTVKLASLLDEAVERASQVVAEKLPDASAEEARTIADRVGIAAVKYADLSKNRATDYIFSFDKMLSFDGNTAPYLLYACARMASLMRRAAEQSLTPSAAPTLEHAAERDLAKHLVRYAATLDAVAARGFPNLLCNYLYELASFYSTFYEACPVLSSEATVAANRLALSQLTHTVLVDGLGLLGIEALERM